MNEQHERIIGVAGGILAVIAALLPWAKLTTVFGELTRNGFDDGGDGLITAALGIIAALAIWQSGRWRIVAIIAAVAIIAVALYDISDVSSIADEDGANVSVGAGLYLTVVAGILAGAVPALQLARRPGRDTTAPTPE